MDKTRIRERLLSLEAHELQDTRDAYAAYVAGAQVEASEPVDDQDESQAIQSRNLSEAFDSPLHDHLHKLDLLKRIDFGPKEKVEEGALVKFDDRYFVIGVATAVFSCDGVDLMGISTQAPIYEELVDGRAGETFTFNGREHVIQEVA